MKGYKTVDFRRYLTMFAAVTCFGLAVPVAWGQGADGNGSTDVKAADLSQARHRDADNVNAQKPQRVAQATAQPAQARPASQPAVEEIVVTAQKKEQGISDVPISLSVINDNFFKERGITGFDDVAKYVPNAKFRTDVGTGVSLNIRGFTKQSGNPAFDQAVGLEIDGVPYNDNDYFQTGLYDVQRVEVLRGPQGTLLGKNTTAGLLNVTTKGPTDTLQGFIDLQAGDYEKKRVEMGIGGPLIPGVLNFRLAGVDDDIDGTIDNTTPPKTPQLGHDRSGIRLKLEAPDLLGSTWGLEYERDEADIVGVGREITDIDAASTAYLRQYDANLDITADNFQGSEDDPTRVNRKVEKLIGRWSDDFAGWDLNFTAGYGDADGTLGIGDGLPAFYSRTRLLTDKTQNTFELVANSPRLFGQFDVTGGLYYEHKNLDLDSQLTLNDSVAAGVLIADLPPSAGGTVLPPGFLGPLPLGPGGMNITLPPQEVSTILFNQDSDSIAAYGQGNWYFADRWTLTVGLRLTQENKDVDVARRFDSGVAPLLSGFLGYAPFDTSDDKDEFHVQPKVALNYKPLDNVSVFLSYAQGFRSGGFNAAAPNGTQNLEYDDETVDDYELNAKTQFFGGKLLLNAGIYRMELDDFQVLTTPPGNGTNTQGGIVVNAGSARAQGVEADATWLATDWLTVAASAAYNDAEFTDFEKGPCASDRGNTDGDSDPRCDVSGAELPFAPDWSASLSPTVHVPIMNNLELQTGLTVLFEDDQTTGIPNDDRFKQDSYAKLDAFVGVGDPQRGWSAKIVGKNLTDEAVNRQTAQIPTTDNFTQNLEPPRLIYGQITWKYQ